MTKPNVKLKSFEYFTYIIGRLGFSTVTLCNRACGVGIRSTSFLKLLPASGLTLPFALVLDFTTIASIKI